MINAADIHAAYWHSDATEERIPLDIQTRRDVLRACSVGVVIAACGLPTSANAEPAEQALNSALLAAVPPHGERSLGDANAPVVVIEYASATCPHCAEFHETVFPEIKARYVELGKVRIVFREFPLDQRALAVFMLARCVPDDQYFATIDLVFRRQKLWNSQNIETVRAELLKIMELAGLSSADVDACLQREDLAKAIFETAKIAREQFGVRGTPTFFVNGKLVDGHEDASALNAAIDAALAAQ